MHHSIKFLIFTLILLSINSSGFAQKKINNTLECSWIEKDLGKVQIGDSRKCKLILKNISSEPITVEYVITSCKCVSAIINRHKIPPQKNTQIKIKFDSSGKNIGETYQSLFIKTSDTHIYNFSLSAEIIQ